MKINRFVETEGGGFRAIGFETEFEQVPGMAENRQVSEDDIIESIDKERRPILLYCGTCNQRRYFKDGQCEMCTESLEN